MPLSVQVLDVAHGRPACGLGLRLERSDGRSWSLVASAVTDESGRVADVGWATPGQGAFRLVIETRRFYALLGLAHAHGEVTVAFDVRDPAQEHHIPVLLAPFGVSTYIGATS